MVPRMRRGGARVLVGWNHCRGRWGGRRCIGYVGA
jgi:hypothetical protein